MKAKKFTKETILSPDTEKQKFPKFNVGDTIRVGQRITEGNKERIQYFEGDVIASRGSGVTSTFTIRKIGANNVAVERILPYHSNIIESIKVMKQGKVRRAKLYYLRERVGKAARIKEKVLTREQKKQKAASQ